MIRIPETREPWDNEQGYVVYFSGPQGKPLRNLKIFRKLGEHLETENDGEWTGKVENKTGKIILLLARLYFDLLHPLKGEYLSAVGSRQNSYAKVYFDLFQI